MTLQSNNQTPTKIKSKLIEQLTYLKKREFSGKVEIKSSSKLIWSLYFYLGRLVGCDGGHHNNRCLKRHLLKYCKLADLEQTNIEISPHHVKSIECKNYQLLISLCEVKLIQREQAIEIINGQMQDVLFDILQQETLGTLHYNVEAEFDSSGFHFNLHEALALVNVEYILKQSYQDWEQWVEAGFEFWSPNFAPVIKKKEILEQMVSPAIYQNFILLINGKRTLRDLAWKMNKDLLLVIRSLAPYIRQGIMGLNEVADILLPSSLSIQKPTIASQSMNKNKPLVVCIDDSKQICEAMKSILSQENYDFLEVREAIQAIPTLISKIPDLIFLDIGMPIMNGYEVCTQIKRVSKLQNIPVVILTGKDGIIDRMRAKMVGASAFLSKPIETDKVLNLAKELLAEQHQHDRPELMTNRNLQANSKLAFG